MQDGGSSETGGARMPSRRRPNDPVTFEIVIAATPDESVVRWLDAVVGADNVLRLPRSLRLSVADQAAMIGVLNGLHDLGLVIERVDRVRHRADEQVSAQRS